MRIILVLFSLSIAAKLFAQDTLKKYYSSGELASLEVQFSEQSSPDHRFREALVEVYNKKKLLVYRAYRRKFAGHASVHLTYHPNGGVKSIRYSSAPDAGIQWYKEYYELDEEGEVRAHRKQSHDDMLSPVVRPAPSIPKPGLTVPDVPSKREQKEFLPNCPPCPQEAACATLMISQTAIVNKTGKALWLKLDSKGIYGAKGSETMLAANDTLFTPEYHYADQFIPREKLYALSTKAATRKATYERLEFSALPSLEIKKSNQEQLIIYYLLD